MRFLMLKVHGIGIVYINPTYIIKVMDAVELFQEKTEEDLKRTCLVKLINEESPLVVDATAMEVVEAAAKLTGRTACFVRGC